MSHATPRLIVRALAAALLFAAATADAAPREWSGLGANDYWDTAANWVGNTVPGPGDDVDVPAVAPRNPEYRSTSGTTSINSLTCGKNLLISGGELQIATTATIGTGGDPKTLQIDGGTLSGAGAVTLSGLFTWRGGTVKNLTVNAGAVTFAYTAKYLDAAILNIAGNANYNAGYLYVSNGGTINVASTATFDITADNLSVSAYTGGGTFNNAGKVRRTTTSGTSTIDITMNNTGSDPLGIDVQSGTLRLSGGGTSSGTIKGTGTLDFYTSYGSTFTVSGPVTVNAVTFTYTGTHTFTGTGANAYNVAGGTSVASSATVNFTGDVTATGPISLAGGTLNFSTPASSLTAASLTQSGGTLTGDDDLNVTTLAWSGGTMEGSATTSASGTSTLSGSTKTLNARTLRNTGTINWTAGYIYLSNGATLDNQSAATFDIRGDFTMTYSGSPGIVTNAGILKKSLGSGTATIGVAVANSGAGTKGVDVQSGTLQLNGGGSSSGDLKGTGTLDFYTSYGSTFTVSGPVTVNAVTFTYSGTHSFTGTGANAYNVPGGTSLSSSPTVNFTGDVTATGPISLAGGTLNFSTPASSFTAASLTQSGGTLTGDDDLNVTTLAWSGGTMEGSVTTSASGTSTLSGSTKTLNARTLRNTGTMNWTGGYIYVSNGATLDNQSAATFDIRGDYTLSYSGTPGTVANAGILKKSLGSGTATIGVAVANSGAGTKGIDVQNGTLQLNGGGSSSGDLKGTGTLEFYTGYGSTFTASGPVTVNAVTFTYSGTHTFTGTGANAYNVLGGTSLSSSPTVNFTGDITATGPLAINGGTLNFNTGETIALASLNFQNGTLGGTDTVNVASLTWNAGTMQDPGTTVVAGVSTVTGSTKTLNARTLRNNGTMNWTGGYFSFSNGGTLENPVGSVFDVKTDNSMSGGSNGTVANAGTFRKSSGGGTATIGVAVSNSGTVQAQSGVLYFSQSYAQTAGTTQLAGGSIQTPYTPGLSISGGQLTGAGTITGHVTLTGTGTVSPGSSAGLVTVTGTYNQGGTSTCAVELGGTAPANFDRVVMSSSGSTGLATLAGTLDVSLINAFAPALGNTFQVMQFGSRSGTFDTIGGVTLGGGRFLKATYTNTTATLTVVSENCYDDVDNDGDSLADCADPDCTGALPKCTGAATTTTTTTSTTSTTVTTTTTTRPPTTTSTTSTTSTTPVPTTTTTTLPPQEVCGDCTDNDGDGAVDYEDTDCCAVSTRLSLKQAKFLAGRGGRPLSGSLTLKATLENAFASLNPLTEAVNLQLRTAAFCFNQTAGPARWKKKGKTGFAFRDPLAYGLQKGAIKVAKTGTATFTISGKRFNVTGFNQPNVTATVRVGERCAVATVPLKTTNKGQVYP